MGFFIRDLHNHIVGLHAQQFAERSILNSFTVYRGQGLMKADFDRMITTQGGLLSFNNFLSTSMDRQVSLAFADSNQSAPDRIGVLFAITINSSISNTVFANIRDVSYFTEEEEILFSMHSIFRIGSIKQIDGNDCLWEVDLTLTIDNDPDLQILTEQMRKETYPEQKGFSRLGALLIKLGQFNKAEEVCGVLLDQTKTNSGKASIYDMLGMVKRGQGEYKEAVAYYNKSMEIKQKVLSSTDADLGTSYNNIGLVYENMGDYSTALESHQKALEICQKTLPSNDPHLANSYNNIASVYANMGAYSNALSYYTKGLEISQKTLPSHHPHLATSYDNIGMVYSNMGDYPKALESHQKALNIYQKTLPSNHPDLAASYNNIGLVYCNMGDYSNALSYYQKGLEICQKTLSLNHPILAIFYMNIASVYNKLRDYPDALESHQKALNIYQKTLPSNHPHLANSYNNIGSTYDKMGDYSNALSYYKKGLEIGQKTLPSNHPHLATSDQLISNDINEQPYRFFLSEKKNENLFEKNKSFDDFCTLSQTYYGIIEKDKHLNNNNLDIENSLIKLAYQRLQLLHEVNKTNVERKTSN
ncbi:unnamed protein product [Rotaria sp. Silwood1]|nr:unnamed protein product [Rotaria sp. Silwood1]